MDNLILFVNRFLEYIILLVIIVIVAALGFIVGRFLGKKKEAKFLKVLKETVFTISVLIGINVYLPSIYLY